MFGFFDFLPKDLNPTVRTAVEALILIHLVAFLIYILLLTRSFFAKSGVAGRNAYIENMKKELGKRD